MPPGKISAKFSDNPGMFSLLAFRLFVLESESGITLHLVGQNFSQGYY